MSYAAQLYLQLPLCVAVIGGCMLLLLDTFARGTSRRWLMHLGVVVSLVGIFACWLVWRRIGAEGPKMIFEGMVVADKFSVAMAALFFAVTALVTAISADFFTEHAVLYGELYPLLQFATAGMIILAGAGDLTTIFLGVETMSIGAYVLTGSFRRAKRSSEAAMKYFVTGAFATGFLLYGIALVYGAAGTTNLAGIAKATGAHSSGVFLTGLLMLIVALGFKVAAVPFHMWAPDAYEGAPTPVTAYMAAGVKAAGIAALMRVFVVGFGGEVLPFGHLGWASILSVLAVLTMTVGNLAALRQENIKRLLAYSSVAHAGYLLVGVIAVGMGGTDLDQARPALVFYLVAYSFTTVGAFAVVAWIGSKGDERQLVDDWAGLATRHPVAAAAMTVFMLSLGGIPPTGGFFGKFYLFRAAMEPDSQLVWLVVAAVLNSVISMFYYLRVVMAMYFREPQREVRPLRSPAITAAIAVCVILVLAMGVIPDPWLGAATSAQVLAAP